ncbi:flagellar biosynthesis protein FliS [Lysinibacillus sp. BF-4]|uniref:flagellar export chaperone FliS n=1 Tax=Lysinibacillus sp. BF-4 TaxID=1473546 RepID=UPI000500A233|nr:flagellar export chaperone FliS [Lysinibacillus sp. BF-4]KFL43938.1 flagellar biosynthesis protein FliS [Lysinibacillus sp. BF-4]
MAAQSSAHNAYKQNSVTTASPGELTLMLYNGCLKFLTIAKKAMLDKNIEAKNTNLQKAQAIITELMVTLDMNVPISKEIQPLYDYMNRRLLEANIQNDPAIIDEVAGLVTEFRDTWKEVILLNRQQQHTGVGDQA